MAQDHAPAIYEEPETRQPPTPPRSLTLRTRRGLRAAALRQKVTEARRRDPARPQGWAALRAQQEAERQRQDSRDFLGFLLAVALLTLAVIQIAKSL